MAKQAKELRDEALEKRFREISRLKGQMIRTMKWLEDDGADQLHILRAITLFDEMTSIAEQMAIYWKDRADDACERLLENRELKDKLKEYEKEEEA